MANGKVWVLAGLGCGAGALLLAMIAACAGLMVVGYRSASSADGEISTAVDELMRRAANGTFAGTYESATTAELRRSVTAADYAKLGDLIKTQLGGLKSKHLDRINLRQVNANSYADVAYQATFERGSGTITATLRRSDGRWLFQSFRVNSPAFMNDLPDQICPKCGGKHAKSARFCPHCGQALTEKAEKEESPEALGDGR